MKRPRERIDGVKEGCIMHLKRPVYGLPDAPRAWYESQKQVLVKEFQFQASAIDPALFIHRNSEGKPN